MGEAPDQPWDALARALASESPDIVLILSPDGMVHHLSAAAEAFFGQPVEALVGQSVIPYIHPEDLALAVDTHVRAIRGELAGLVSYRVRDRAGAWRWLEVSKQPLRDPRTGKVPAVFEIARDVTARRENEQRLIENEARLRLALAIARTGSFEVEIATGRARLTDEMCRIMGFAPTDPPTTFEAVARRFHPEDAAMVAEVARALAAGGGPGTASYRLRVTRLDGAARVLQVLVAQVEDPVRGALRVGVARDVTEEDALRQAEAATREALERARDAAEAASLAKSMFLANVSHELRTPLNAIIGYAELVGEEAEDLGAAALAPDLAKIRQAATHLLGLINDVLDLAKIEAGALVLEVAVAEPEAIAREAIANVEPLAHANGNVQELRVAPGLPRYRGDVTKVRQCLTNLLGNAHKFTRQGRVTLEVAREEHDQGPWLRFEVLDTGIGMTAEDQARVFEQFTQADAGTTRRFGGTGLGLTLVRAFARAMGGEVTLRSAPDQGTAVTLRLPAQGGPVDPDG